jgi:hypothetical protein
MFAGIKRRWTVAAIHYQGMGLMRRIVNRVLHRGNRTPSLLCLHIRAFNCAPKYFVGSQSKSAQRVTRLVNNK